MLFHTGGLHRIQPGDNCQYLVSPLQGQHMGKEFEVPILVLHINFGERLICTPLQQRHWLHIKE